MKSITGDVDAELSAESDFNNAHVCFTGELKKYTRTEAAELVAVRGGILQDNVTKKTNFLVVGHSEFLDIKNGKKTGKLRKAEEYAGRGQNLRIISEADFIRLLFPNEVFEETNIEETNSVGFVSALLKRLKMIFLG